MALKAILTKEEHSALGDALKSEYVEKDGKFFLDVTAVNGFALEDVQGLKGALQTERDAHATTKKVIEKFGDLDADAARAAIAKVEEMKDWKPDDKVKGQIEAVKAELEKKHGDEMATITGEKTELEKALHQNIVTRVATESLAKHEGAVDLLLPHVEKQIKVEKTSDGKFVAKVIDPATGNTRISMEQGNTGDMKIDELVGLMKDDDRYGSAFKGSGAEGIGAGGNENNKGGGIDMSLPPEERLRLARQQKQGA